MFLKNLRGETMNFDTPPQALTICGEWNKILKIPGTSGRPRRTACLPARTLRGLGEQPAVQQMYQQKLKEIMQTERIKK